LFAIKFTITQKGSVRMYINNDQDSSNGNDFGLRNIRIVRVESGAGSMSVPAEQSKLRVYTGPRPAITYP
jgi:acid phosphatase class B